MVSIRPVSQCELEEFRDILDQIDALIYAGRFWSTWYARPLSEQLTKMRSDLDDFGCDQRTKSAHP